MEQVVAEKNVLNDILELAKTKDFIIEMIDLFPYNLQGISQKELNDFLNKNDIILLTGKVSKSLDDEYEELSSKLDEFDDMEIIIERKNLKYKKHPIYQVIVLQFI